ncbi:MAG: hypothetical protein KatS3mg033_1584 [Thermonema sp.]|jgi:vacuolar-type H+-ATPase subunit H|uniref:hypothetical protein n=1 Tax=Thermonema TaxID=28194 RepID=UPI00056DAC7A|nr:MULTISPECIES: hypothetical protein [Thermonema]GIV39784.1 MAG: hypothetical protein KatS3mg033_1584 [Thermonema sp.]
MKKFEELKNIVLAAEEDAKKFYEKDNQAAGTRLRKAMQQLKELAHDIRKEVQEIKNSKKGA